MGNKEGGKTEKQKELRRSEKEKKKAGNWKTTGVALQSDGANQDQDIIKTLHFKIK